MKIKRENLVILLIIGLIFPLILSHIQVFLMKKTKIFIILKFQMDTLNPMYLSREAILITGQICLQIHGATLKMVLT